MRENTVKSNRNIGGGARIPGDVVAKGQAQAGRDSLVGELPYGPLV